MAITAKHAATISNWSARGYILRLPARVLQMHLLNLIVALATVDSIGIYKGMASISQRCRSASGACGPYTDMELLGKFSFRNGGNV